MIEQKNTIEPISEEDITAAKIASMPTRPNSIGLYGTPAMSSKTLKERMDALPLLAVNKINELIAYIKGTDFSDDILLAFGDEEISLKALVEQLELELGNSDFAARVTVDEEGATLIEVLDTLRTDVEQNTSGIETLDENLKNCINEFSNLQKKQIAHEASVQVVLEQIRDEVNGAFDALTDYADSLALESEVES